MIMRLPEKEALEYLNDPRLGFKIKSRKYNEVKKEILDSRNERLDYIAKQGFVDQHLERLAQIELVNEEMWKEYRKGNYRALDALGKIAEVQNLLSLFYDASKAVMQDSISQRNSEKASIPITAV